MLERKNLRGRGEDGNTGGSREETTEYEGRGMPKRAAHRVDDEKRETGEREAKMGEDEEEGGQWEAKKKWTDGVSQSEKRKQ
jgi:hypothetical protein